jgi:hypothetical protein
MTVGMSYWLFLIMPKELQISYRGLRKQCFSNIKNFQVEKITIVGSWPINLTCNIQICTPGQLSYNINSKGETIETLVNFTTRKIIIEKFLYSWVLKLNQIFNFIHNYSRKSKYRKNQCYCHSYDSKDVNDKVWSI